MTVLAYLLGFLLVSVVSSVLIGTALGRNSAPASSALTSKASRKVTSSSQSAWVAPGSPRTSRPIPVRHLVGHGTR